MLKIAVVGAGFIGSVRAKYLRRAAQAGRAIHCENPIGPDEEADSRSTLSVTQLHP